MSTVANSLQHICGESIGGRLQKIVPPEWDWTRAGGEYRNHRNFFSVHWEVQERDPNSVRLHVESPRNAVDPVLNDLKRKIIDAILLSKLSSLVSGCGYQYVVGRKITLAAIQNSKSTEPFRVVLTEMQRSVTTEQDIRIVHAAIGPHIELIVQKFRKQLDHLFC